MAKKELTATDVVMDLITKLKPIFKKDVYIKDNLFVFSGDKSDEDIAGDVLCIIDQLIRPSVIDYFGTHPLIYIKDLAEFKKDPENNMEVYDDKNDKYNKLTALDYKIEEIIKNTDTWKSFAKEPHDLCKTLFEENSYVKFDDQKGAFIVLGKNLFPSITIKSLDRVFYAMIDDVSNDENVRAMIVDFHHPYFQQLSLYYYIPIGESAGDKLFNQILEAFEPKEITTM